MLQKSTWRRWHSAKLKLLPSMNLSNLRLSFYADWRVEYLLPTGHTALKFPKNKLLIHSLHWFCNLARSKSSPIGVGPRVVSTRKNPGKAATAATPSSRTRAQVDSAMTTDVGTRRTQTKAGSGKPPEAGEAAERSSQCSSNSGLWTGSARSTQAAQALALRDVLGASTRTVKTRKNTLDQ